MASDRVGIEATV